MDNETARCEHMGHRGRARHRRHGAPKRPPRRACPAISALRAWLTGADMHDARSCTRTAPRAPPTVHLAATSGGHLDLLMGLSDSFAAYRRVWVVSPGSATDALAADGEKVILLPRFNGLTRRNARLGLCSLRPALRERPRLVVTSGSGSVVPFCLSQPGLWRRESCSSRRWPG